MLLRLVIISNKGGIDDDADADADANDADERSLQTRGTLMMSLMLMMLMIISNKGGIDAAWAAGGRRWHLVGRAHKPPVLAHHQVK